MEKTIERNLEPKVCEACGERFGCGAKSDGCWCSEIVVPESVSEDISAKYPDCLCPNCLKSLAGNAIAQPRY